MAVLRAVVLTSSARGARVDENPLSSFEVVREAVVPLLRGAGVSCTETLGRSVPLGTRVGGLLNTWEVFGKFGGMTLSHYWDTCVLCL